MIQYILKNSVNLEDLEIYSEVPLATARLFLKNMPLNKKLERAKLMIKENRDTFVFTEILAQKLTKFAKTMTIITNAGFDLDLSLV